MPSSHRISEAEWQRHKAEIERLYIKDGRNGRTLKEVMTMMVERHSFHANKEQYVRRFKKWNLSKNSTDQDWAIIGHKIQKRQRNGKASAVFHKGEMIPEKKIKKNISRYSRLASDRHFQHAASPTTPKDMTVCTPDNQDQPFVFSLGIPWFTYQEQFDSQIRLAMMRQADAGGSLGLWTTKLNDDTNLSVMPHFLSDLDRKRRSMPLPTASDMTKLVKHEQEYRSNSYSEPPWEILSVRTGIEIVQAMIFMSSNNLSTRHDMDHFLKSVIDRDMRWALKVILSPKSPTAEILATNLLPSACRTDDLETIRLLLSVGADPNARSELSQRYGFEDTPLFLAVKNGCTSTVKLLIEVGAKIDPGLLTAAMSLSNPIEMVGLLLQAGAAVQSLVLGAAVASGNIELVGMILNAGASDVVDPTALQMAAKNNNIDMVRRLLMNHRDVNFPSAFRFNKYSFEYFQLLQDKFQSPLVLAVQNGNIEMIQALLDAGADIDFAPGLESKQKTWNLAIESAQKTGPTEMTGYLRQMTNTALQTAVYQENLELVQFLLAAGASANTCHCGDTALQIAAKRNSVPLVRILLAYGASVDAPAHWPFGRTALQAASANGNLYMIDLLLGTTPASSWFKCLNMPPSPIGGRTALQAAAENGHVSTVQYLLQLNADINGPTADLHGATVVQAAVRSGNLYLASLVLSAGAETGTPSGTSSALGIAIDQHDLSMFESMFIHAANFCSTANEEEGLILQRAAEQESPIFLETLIHAGWNVNEIWRHGHPETAIRRAVQKCRIANVLLLLHAGADPQRALVNEVDCMDTKLLTLLLEHGADPNVVGDKPYNFTPLARVASRAWYRPKNLPVIKILLNAGAAVDCPAPGGRSMLASAVDVNDIELCKLMLAAGADPNWRDDKSDVTALGLAVSGGSDEIFHLLITSGAAVNVPTAYEKSTALQIAASVQNLGFVRALLQLRADVNAPPGYLHPNEYDQFYSVGRSVTALQAACFGDSEEIINILLGAGAHINAPAGPLCGMTALQAAARIGDLNRVQMLLQKGADVNAPACEERGVTALQAASIGGHLAVVILLLHEGADMNSAKSLKAGRTALEGAAEHGRLDVIYLLLQNDHKMEGFYDRCEDAAIFAEREGHTVIARILRNYRKD